MLFDDEITPELEEQFEQLCNTDPFQLIDHIAPELEGYRDLKLSVLLILLTPRDLTPTQRDRLHLLMYGKPGTGKTVILRWLHRTFNAEYLTHDTTKASLKGDARRKDLGVQILQRAHGRIVCFDEFSMLKDREELRDAMEDGFYKITKAGREQVFPAEIRVVAATNEVKLSDAMQDRFDLTHEMLEPTPDLSTRVAKRLTRIYAGLVPDQTSFIKQFVEWANDFEPRIPHDMLSDFDKVWELYFDLTGRGWSGRRIASVLRIARALARLHHRDVLPEDIIMAIRIKDPMSEHDLKRLQRLIERV